MFDIVRGSTPFFREQLLTRSQFPQALCCYGHLGSQIHRNKLHKHAWNSFWEVWHSWFLIRKKSIKPSFLPSNQPTLFHRLPNSYVFQRSPLHGNDHGATSIRWLLTHHTEGLTDGKALPQGGWYCRDAKVDVDKALSSPCNQEK